MKMTKAAPNAVKPQVNNVPKRVCVIGAYPFNMIDFSFWINNKEIISVMNFWIPEDTLLFTLKAN